MLSRLTRSAALNAVVIVCVLSPAMAADAQEAAFAIPAIYSAQPKADLKAGEWIASESLPEGLGLPGAARQLRYVYGATDGADGKNALPASGALFIPPGEAPAGGWPIVAWAHGTVGIADRCAPSLTPRSARDAQYLGAWLNEGYAIVASDYQGLGTPGPHPYLHTRAEAYSLLDGVRAALQGVPGLANKVLLVGQSQGAGAAFATAGYAPDYAPELNIVGTVATGLPNPQARNTSVDPDAVDRTIAYLLYIAASAEALDPSLTPDLALQERALPAYQAASRLCVQEMFQKVVNDGLTRNNALRPTFAKVYAKLLGAIGYHTLALKQALFVGTGERDIDTPTAGQLVLVRATCAAGTTVEAHLYAGLDHSGTVNPSFKDSVVFARKVMTSQPITPQCEPQAQ
jgi:pimeloyl-ACP methyl ester carboxylesterase